MNNRQAGRRRGRGGQRTPGGSPNAGNGNRIDNRARGNAAQLLEKYKNLARDAQMQGDRVNTEYYLQFADHYFRVLGESRSRFDEQTRRRDENFDDDGDDGFDDGEIETARADEGQRYEPRDQQGRRDGRDQPREARENRPEPRDNRREGRDGNRDERANGQVNGHAQQAPARNGHADAPIVESAEGEQQPRRRGRPRREQPREEVAESFDAAVLPPAIANDEAPVEKPRRRRRVAAAELPEGDPAAAIS